MNRVAVCFWGQTRTFSTLKEYKKLNHQDIKFDFFISTWDDFKDKSHYSSFKDKEFIDPEIFKFKNNTDRAFYLIHRVNNMKSKYEMDNGFIYDYIIWTRSEILYETKYLLQFLLEKLNFEKNDDNHKIFEVNTLSPIRTDIEKDASTIRLDADFSFLGTSLAFDMYASGWKYYFKSKGCDNFHGLTGGHHAHATVIKKFNLELVPCKIAHKFLFSKLYEREV